MSRTSRRAGTTRRAVTRRAVQVVTASVSATLLLAIGYAWYTTTTLTDNAHTLQVGGLGEPTPPPTSPAAPDGSSSVAGSSPATAMPHVTGKQENILLVGDDSRAGLSPAQRRALHVADDVTTSTDTIIIVHVATDGRTARMVSIPRDSYVEIPGYRRNKINAAYADGYYDSGATSPAARRTAGASELVAAVKQLTGVTIDHYVQVGFAGFVDIVKAIGDIPVTLCHSVDDPNSGFHMSAGPHLLDPQQALEFVRQRHNLPGVGDDIGREQRQRYFLTAASRKVLSAGVLLNPSRMHRLMTALDESITTDRQDFDITRFAEQMSDLRVSGIDGEVIPTTNGPDVPGVGSVLSVDPAAVAAFVHRVFTGAPTRPAASHPAAGGSAGAGASRGPAGGSGPAARSCIN